MAGPGLVSWLRLLCVLSLPVIAFVQGVADTGSNIDGSSKPLARLARSAESSGDFSACRSLKIEMCEEFNYTSYMFPNVLGHPDKRAAMREIMSFYPLSSAPCGGRLFRQFICALYFPPCTILRNALPPCQSLCLKARESCSAYVKRQGYYWPHGWTCENFPESGLCIEPEKSNSEVRSSSSSGRGQNKKRPEGEQGETQTGSSKETSTGGWRGKEKSMKQKAALNNVCDDKASAIVSCRRVCQLVYSECSFVMANYGFHWPEYLTCGRLPETGACWDGPEEDERPRQESECREFSSPMCNYLNYNMASFPNLLGHRDPREADMEVSEYLPLIRYRCSPEMQDFLCGVHFPQCTARDQQDSILPCRPLCVQARSRCIEVLERFGYQWPEKLNCEIFPDSGMCWNGTGIGILDIKSKNSGQSVSPQAGEQTTPVPETESRCQPFDVPLCSGMSYNLTSFPNMFGHRRPEDAGLEVHQFYPLIQVECSPQLRDFLCGAYFPQCSQQSTVLPCRSLCIQARSGCIAVMRQFGFQWPEHLNCERFPESGTCWNGTRIGESENRCQPFDVPLCSKLSYNMTSFPNMLGHRRPEDASLEVQQYYPLIKVECSPQLQDFLCGVYFPQCSQQSTILPCRSLCIQSRSGCIALMRQFGFQWPENLNCERFPESGTCWNGTGIGEQTTPVPKIESRCQPFDAPLCSKMSYNLTSFPNMLGHRLPLDAALELHLFSPLVKVGCSPLLLDFLCGSYFPQCTASSQQEIVMPCRSLCVQARSGCRGIMRDFGFTWPESLDCERFPDSGTCWNGTGKGEQTTPVPKTESRCQPFDVPLCSKMSYNMTSFPNMLGHRRPIDAGLELQLFSPLVKVGCSPLLLDFLCGSYFPQCNASSQQEIVMPCRSLCVKARSGCRGIMRDFGFTWPENLDCERFPDSGTCWNGTGKGPTSTTEVLQENSTAVQIRPEQELETVTVEHHVMDNSLLIKMLNSTFKTPVLNWLRSSSKANWAQVKLAGEQMKVARLTREKLTLEISRLKKEGKDRG